MGSMSMAFVSSECISLSSQLKSLSLSSSSSSSHFPTSSLSFFSHRCLSLGTTRKPHSFSVVCEAATTSKADSAVKRARQAETRRLRNRARKSEVRTHMRKVLILEFCVFMITYGGLHVLEALDALKKKSGAASDEIISVEKLIADACSAIDKAVVKGTLHRNTGTRHKSRLARNKKLVEIHHGWYTPAPEPIAA